MKPDTLIIGAGHNGLVAALYLARAGQTAMVLEKDDRPGGICRSEEFAPGYVLPGILHDSCTLQASVVDDLALDRHGLVRRQGRTAVLVPKGQGKALILNGDSNEPVIGLTSADVAGYLRWQSQLRKVLPWIARLMSKRPPLVESVAFADLLDLAKTGFALRRLGSEGMLDLLRVAPMSVSDWLEEYFEDPSLAAALVAPSLLGSFVGPRQAGTTANLLMHESLSDRPVQGGPGAAIRAMLSAAEELGVKIRTNAEVVRIIIERDRVEGVVLKSGEEIRAQRIISSCDPKQTFLRLIHPTDLPVELVKEFQAVRSRGIVAKIDLGLKGYPEFAQYDGVPFERVRLGGGLNDLEKAYDAPKYGTFSDRPYLDVWIPSLSDSTLAPEGHHVVSLMVQCAPYQLKDGWTQERRVALYDAVMNTLDRFGPSVREQVCEMRILTPTDLEELYGMTGGHLHHVESALDQAFFMRPAVSSGRYTTPVAGLLLGSSGCHPGGGITGLPGALAARTLLEE